MASAQYDSLDRSTEPPARWQRLLFWGLVASGLLAFIAAGWNLGFTHPTPWPDEGSFLWQAIAFQERTSLFAPELNPDRDVLWMPPGFMVFDGVIFKLTGFTLGWARTLSTVYLAATALALAALFRPLPLRLGHALLLGIAFQFPIVVMAGNTARMEPLVLLFGAAAFVLLQKRHSVAALCVAALAPLIHPNGVFFCVGAAAVVLGERIQTGTIARRRWEWGLVALPFVSWSAYAVYVGLHWASFENDMGHQLVWKVWESAVNQGRIGRAADPHASVPALLLALSLLVLRRRASTHALLGMAVSLLLASVLTTGWLYEIYAVLLYLLLAVLISEAVATVAARRLTSTRKALVVAAAASAAVLGAVGLLSLDPYLSRSVDSATVPQDGKRPPYLVASDRLPVEQFLQQLEAFAPKPLRVQFVPAGDALLFADYRTDKLRFLQQTFYDGKADAYIFHDSSWFPPFVRDVYLLQLWGQELRTPIEQWPVLRQRDGTEIWRATLR